MNECRNHLRFFHGIVLCRVPEVIFQPPMVGVDQGGLSETIDYVLKYYSADTQQRLVQVR